VTRRIQHALVTGASAGLGAEFARQLAARGVALTLVARRREALDALAASLPVAVEVLTADLTSADGLAEVADRLRAPTDPIDLLVNNAGFGAYGDVVDLDVDRQATMIDLNVRALTTLAHAAASAQLARGEGGIINVGSTAGFQPNPGGATYGATKAYVRSFTEALHEELRDRGVHVLLLAPGFTETEFQAVAGVADGAVPAAARMTAAPVVEAALADFARGRAVSIPGAANRVSALGADVTPSIVTRRLSKLVHERFAG
jgi:uncharacterized protein